jgi:heme-degrading monooxygenase HmoA
MIDTLSVLKKKQTHPLNQGENIMIIANVKFETVLSDEEAMQVAKERLPLFLDIPGLIQKYYVKTSQPNEWMGVYIWDSMEAMASFRESDLAKSIPAAYKVKGQPQIEVNNVPMTLRA